VHGISSGNITRLFWNNSNTSIHANCSKTLLAEYEVFIQYGRHITYTGTSIQSSEVGVKLKLVTSSTGLRQLT
jgi:hypothetical protein